MINGNQSYPFALCIMHNDDGELEIDTDALGAVAHWRAVLVQPRLLPGGHGSPSGYVQFLRGMLPPRKPKAEIAYTMLGSAKQGKNTFYRDFMHHLQHSNDDFIIAPGIRGLVMLVFTLPSYPCVQADQRRVLQLERADRPTVKAKYLLVKRHDRVGCMADTLEYSNVAFPKKALFTEELLIELRTLRRRCWKKATTPGDQALVHRTADEAAEHLPGQRHPEEKNTPCANTATPSKTRPGQYLLWRHAGFKNWRDALWSGDFSTTTKSRVHDRP